MSSEPSLTKGIAFIIAGVAMAVFAFIDLPKDKVVLKEGRYRPYEQTLYGSDAKTVVIIVLVASGVIIITGSVMVIQSIQPKNRS